MSALWVPNGYFCQGSAIWGNPGAGSILSRFCAVDFPDLSASDDQAFIDLESDCRLMLGCMKPEERLQVYVYTGSDFSGDLDRFEAETAKSRIPISTEIRTELVQRYRERMKAETLIQSNVRLCLSTKMPAFEKDGGKKVRGFDGVFKILSRSFEQRQLFFDMLLRSQGGSVQGLDNKGLYEEMLRFWSPDAARRPRCTDLDWLRPIENLCRFSGLSPRHSPGHGFYCDGYYFGLLVARTMPRQTWARTMEPFLALTIPNLRLVLNLQPLEMEQEIRYEAERFAKLVSNVDAKDPDLQSLVGMDTHKERMRLLMSNRVIPFRAQLIVIACDRTVDGLDARMESLRAALGKTGCEPHEPSVATSVVSFFNCATPGVGPWINYRDFWHKVDDAVNAVNLIPASSTPCGSLRKAADWITDGACNQIIAGRMFTGALPDHMMVAASTGAGKSSTVQTIVLQTAPMYRFIVVIDDGLSWMTTCHKLDPGCQPIIIRSNGEQTFNPFDTRGQPLSAQHLASATALCHLLVGQSPDPDRDKLRVAILSETISQIYGVAYRSWRNKNPEEHFMLAPDLDDSPGSEEYRQSIAFARWTPAMFPTLSDLQDELHAEALQEGPHQELCATLASLLRPWLRDGRYGILLDGPSNVDLGSTTISESDPLKVVHFELGSLGESESELRAVAGFLITNEVRNHIEGMDRGIKKLVVLEELTGLLKVPNADKMARDFYERSRKFSTQVISIFQQYSTLLDLDPKLAKALIGNSAALLLLRNHNRKDLEILSGYLPRPLPGVIQDQITRFPRPAELPPDQAYAGFVYAQIGAETPQYTVGRNYISEAVEAITSSSGSDFERKRKELRDSVRNNHQENIAGRNGNQPVDVGRLRVGAEVTKQLNG